MSSTLQASEDGLWRAVTGDGRPLLGIFAVGLGLAGAFAWFVSIVGETLPHELRFLGMTAPELHALAGGRVADFMTHDRVAFGGTLIALAVLYLWIVSVPLAAGERWAWNLVAVSGAWVSRASSRISATAISTSGTPWRRERSCRSSWPGWP